MRSFVAVLFVGFAMWQSCDNPFTLGGDFADEDQVKDTLHLKQHLEEKIEVDGKEWDRDQHFFHYFTMSDLNHDLLIDGTEVGKSVTHQHGAEERVWSDEEIEGAVDPILRKIDTNMDGVIDYPEYRLKLDL